MVAMATMATLAARLLALTAALALAWTLRFYPFGHGWPSVVLAILLPAYLVLLWLRPAIWLFCLPCLLPVLDLAPWTGWFFIEEIDLLLLVTVACRYARWPVAKAGARAELGWGACLLLMLTTLAWLVSLARGLPPLAHLPTDLLTDLLTQLRPDLLVSPTDALPGRYDFSSYLSPLNGLRLIKAWAWALLLLPLLRRDANPFTMRRLALPGVLTGLALVALCALWERAVFPGLSNLASDYRITAPFSAMHTGGAALDGYLALTLPFAALWLVRARTRWQTALALLLLALSLHAALVTFSRGLYAALLAGSLVALACLLHAHRVANRASYRATDAATDQVRSQGITRPPRMPLRSLALAALLMLAYAVLLTMTFSAAGYRGLAAAVLLLLGAFVLASQALPWRMLPAAIVCALILQALLAMLWPPQPALQWRADADMATGQFAGFAKAPYMLMLMSSLLLAGALWHAQSCKNTGRTGAHQGALCVAVMAWTMMACNSAWISWHWAGAGALPAAAMVITLASVVLGHALLPTRWRKLTGHTPGQALWRLDRASISAAGAALMLFMLAIPVSASYYAGERFTTTGGDWQGRLRHWQQALSMLPDDPASIMLGMGLGTFPRSYYWHNRLGETPARLDYRTDKGEHYLRMVSPAYQAGYGELLRLLQRVELQPDTAYNLALDVRRHTPLPVLQVRLCQRQLLYAQQCVGVPLRLGTKVAMPPVWQHHGATVDSAWLGRGPWLMRAPVQLELAAAGGKLPGLIDVDKLSLRGPDGRDVLVNGDFSHGHDGWFFSSDHHHLPWHIKNIWLHLLIESGLCGALALASLLMLSASRLWQRLAEPEQVASPTAMLAALAAFLVVGIFDSLLDVPRLALLFYLLLLYTLLRYRLKRRVSAVR